MLTTTSRWGLALLVVALAAGGISTGPCGDGPVCARRRSLFAEAAMPTGAPCRWYPKTANTTRRWVEQAKGDSGRLKGRHLGVCGTNDDWTLSMTLADLPEQGASRTTYKLIQKAKECDQASHSGRTICEKITYCQYDSDTHTCAVHGRYYDMEYRSCPQSKAWNIFNCMARYKRAEGCRNSGGDCWWLAENGGMCLGKEIPRNVSLANGSLSRWWDQNLGSVDNEAQFWSFRSVNGTKAGACEKLLHAFESMKYMDRCWDVNYLPDSTEAGKTKRDNCFKEGCNWLWFPGEKAGEPPYWECRPHTPIAEGKAYGHYYSHIKEQATQCYDPDLTERGKHACENYELY